MIVGAGIPWEHFQPSPRTYSLPSVFETKNSPALGSIWDVHTGKEVHIGWLSNTYFFSLGTSIINFLPHDRNVDEQQEHHHLDIAALLAALIPSKTHIPKKIFSHYNTNISQKRKRKEFPSVWNYLTDGWDRKVFEEWNSRGRTLEEWAGLNLTQGKKSLLLKMLMLSQRREEPRNWNVWMGGRGRKEI